MLCTSRLFNYCLNCLKPGHFVRECKSLHRCRKCQKPHHSLLHVEPKISPLAQPFVPSSSNPVNPVTSNLATNLVSSSLLMICFIIGAKHSRHTKSSLVLARNRTKNTVCLAEIVYLFAMHSNHRKHKHVYKHMDCCCEMVHGTSLSGMVWKSNSSVVYGNIPRAFFHTRA